MIIMPFTWTSAIDARSITHRVISTSINMHLCRARCGLVGRWSHADKRVTAAEVPVLRSVIGDVTCMACVAAGLP